MSERYDAVVVDGGPTGEHAVGILNDDGKKVALVEREFAGGECSISTLFPTACGANIMLGPIQCANW
jgi:pyruvate/2-oxoglutarate dehydrogenase complex dihydrolipoamide dehydrogenase (E3) component